MWNTYLQGIMSQKHFGSSFIVSESNSMPGFVGFQLWYLNNVGSKEKVRFHALISVKREGTLCTGGYKQTNCNIPWSLQNKSRLCFQNWVKVAHANRQLKKSMLLACWNTINAHLQVLFEFFFFTSNWIRMFLRLCMRYGVFFQVLSLQ